VNPERKLLSALFSLEATLDHAGRGMITLRPRMGQGHRTIRVESVTESLGLSVDGQPRFGDVSTDEGPALVVYGGSSPESEPEWQARLQLNEEPGLHGGVLYLRGTAAVLGFLLAGVVLARELIETGDLVASIGALASLIRSIERRRISLVEPVPMLELWAWAELTERGALAG
jgi:hypothetical protein